MNKIDDEGEREYLEVELSLLYEKTIEMERELDTLMNRR